MNSQLRARAQQFDALKLRERALVVVGLIAALSLLWWNFFADPRMLQTSSLEMENERIGQEVTLTRQAIAEIRNRIASGFDKDKDIRLAKLQQDLAAVEESLRLKTIELIDPAHMFGLMKQLVYKESRLKLLSLKRLEVRPALILPDDLEGDAGIYRHVLEVKFSGKYLDILRYMQTLEELDWKLIWDEIEIVSGDYPMATVKLVISTLSTRKEWVGV